MWECMCSSVMGRTFAYGNIKYWRIKFICKNLHNKLQEQSSNSIYDFQKMLYEIFAIKSCTL